MSEQTIKLFLVDDDPSARMLARIQLEHLDLDVQEFGDGPSCRAALEYGPDIIVLDVDMPGENGIAVCTAIRAAGNAGIQIIFLSGHDDLETRLAAYDAGGNDFIVKPCAPEEMARKIGVAVRAVESVRATTGQAQFAQKAAFTAMSSMAEMGVIHDFLRASFICQTTDELGRAICAALEQFGLHGLAKLHDERGACYYSSGGECTALEVSLLHHARGLERIFQFSDRLAINYPHTTLLIPDLPLSDPDLVGRLRDHLAVLAEGAEARFLALRNEALRLDQAEEVMAAVSDLTMTLEDIERHQEDYGTQVIVIANDQLNILAQTFVHLGLSEAQEEALVEVTQQGINRISQLQDGSAPVKQRLREVTARLKKLTTGNG